MSEGAHNSQIEADDLALDFLEQWLAAPSGESATEQRGWETLKEVTSPTDPSLRAIERLVHRHQDLFRRAAQNQ